MVTEITAVVAPVSTTKMTPMRISTFLVDWKRLNIKIQEQEMVARFLLSRNRRRPKKRKCYDRFMNTLIATNLLQKKFLVKIR